MTLVWTGVFVALGPMSSAGVSDSVVWGLYPATAPLIVAGPAWAGLMAARRDWAACGSGLAAVAVGAVGLPFGPANAWAVFGVGIFVLLIVRAAQVARRQRA